VWEKKGTPSIALQGEVYDRSKQKGDQRAKGGEGLRRAFRVFVELGGGGRRGSTPRGGLVARKKLRNPERKSF